MIESVVHVTMPGNELMREIHNAGSNPYRMPAILRKEDREAWLTGTIDAARSVLKPYPSELMVAYQVSPRVNSPRNNDERLLEPAQAA
jgi:putative SOS response-associated peptidase YedK